MDTQHDEIQLLITSANREFKDADIKRKDSYNAVYIVAAAVNIAAFAVAYPLRFADHAPHYAMGWAARWSAAGFLLSLFTMICVWLAADSDARYWYESMHAPKGKIHAAAWRRQRYWLMQIQYGFITCAVVCPIVSLVINHAEGRAKFQSA